MNYKEIHLINNIIIKPPGEITDYRFCPREEIAHPIKLQIAVENSKTIWNQYTFDKNTFYVYWFPWYRKYNIHGESIYTSVFHILTEKPALFKTFYSMISSLKFNKFADTDTYDINRLLEWLIIWWNEAFLITVPILHSVSGPFICNSNYPFHQILLNRYCPDDYLNVLLENQSYTFGNGLILLLAYHRLGIIPARILKPVLEIFLKMHPEYFYQNVNDQWNTLYYSSRIAHIADFPAYYVCMGPHFAHKNIVELFKPYFDYNFAVNIYPHFIFYTTPFSAIFPYFNLSLWEVFRNNANEWLDCVEYDPENNEKIIPDLSGFIHGILLSKPAWKFWLSNSNKILTDLFNTYMCNEKLIEDILQICSYFYTYGSFYHNRSIKKKTRAFWNIFQVFINENVSPNENYMFNVLKKYTLKYQIYERIKIIDCKTKMLLIEIPYPLLKEITFLSTPSIHFYMKSKYIIISQYIEILKRIYPDIEESFYIKDADIPNLENAIITKLPQYILSRSLLNIYQDSSKRSVMNIFYVSCIEKRILSRLCTIYKVFGMYLNENNTYNNYAVGCMIIEYFRKNKEYLIG